jgi:hypothetical protein
VLAHLGVQNLEFLLVDLPAARGPCGLRYSAATGEDTLGELAEWDPTFAALFALGALISASGLSDRRDFPSK